MNLQLSLIHYFYHNKFTERLVHTLAYLLKNEMADCKTVLDLGCGPASLLELCKTIEYSVGVEVFEPYLEITKAKRTHTEYLNKKIEELTFADNSFDAVIMIGVIEHLPKETGRKILKKAGDWAKKKVIINMPNGFMLMP